MGLVTDLAAGFMVIGPAAAVLSKSTGMKGLWTSLWGWLRALCSGGSYDLVP